MECGEQPQVRLLLAGQGT